MYFVPEGQHDRSLARSAWDSATQKSRPVGYGLIRVDGRTDSTIGVIKFRLRQYEAYLRRKMPWNVWDSYARSYRALRDGSLGRRFPRRFVPGYDHAVPPGTKYILRAEL
jgi:hypothetical protein